MNDRKQAPRLASDPTVPARAEDLLVGVFLSQMGPGQAPPELVERVAVAVRRELAASSAAKNATWSWDRGARIGLAWAVDAPRLALGSVVDPPGVRQTLAGLSTLGYAVSFLQGAAPQAPKRRKHRVARFLLRLGAKR